MNSWYERDSSSASPFELAPSRSQFLTRTYVHLLGAILALVAIEAALFSSGAIEPLARSLFRSQMMWLGVIAIVSILGWLTAHVAHTAYSLGVQYAMLGVTVVLQAVVLAPLLFIADRQFPGAISNAALVTIVGFTALSMIVFFTREDFSFLRSIVMWGFLIALGLVIASLIFQFQLGVIFIIAMIGLAGASVLYDTSNVLHHYPEDRYVGASMQLFSSIVILFWYILRLFMRRN